jgi:hypothetical protein
MEYFTVDEIIWAKIRGYPWWPAMIKGIEEDNKEIKYRVSFIGDNTHATLPKRNLSKFEKEYKINSNTKKKNLLDSIKIAKELYDCKKGLKENNLKENLIDDINKNNEKEKKINNISPSKNENEKIEESALSEKSSNFKDNTFLKKKLKRIDEKNGLDIAHKITNYLASIVIQIKKKKFVIENEKNYMIKVMKFLKDFKMNEPIDYLRKGSLGKIIKFINENISDEEVKNLSYEVYKCFEEQVLNQLFRKKQ